MIRRIRPESFLALLRGGEPWVAGTVLEEIHLVPCSVLRKAARENHFDALKVGTLFFYQADQVASHIENMDRLADSGAQLRALPGPAAQPGIPEVT